MLNPSPNPQAASHPTVVTDSENDEPSNSPHQDRRGSFTESEASEHRTRPPPVQRSFTPTDIMRRQQEREDMRRREENEMSRFQDARERNQFYRDGLRRPQTRPLQEEPHLMIVPQQSNTGRRWEPRFQPVPPNLEPVAVPATNNDRSHSPPLNQYSTTSQNPELSYARQPGISQSQREQRFWDDYNADPNISGQRWGELDRAKVDLHKDASYQYSEQPTSRRERSRNGGNRRRPPRLPTPSPQRRPEPYPHVPPYRNPPFNPQIDRNGPSSYRYPVHPPDYNYPHAPTRPSPPRQTAYHYPNAPSGNYDAPFANQYDLPMYPQPYLGFQPSGPRVPPPNPLRQRSYFPVAESYQNEPHYRPESFAPHFNDIHNASRRPASNRPRESSSDDQSYSSSSDEEEPRPKTPEQLSIDEVDPVASPIPESISRFMLPSIDGQIDEDLLDPARWASKAFAIETVVKNSHRNRSSWPNAWRHSDSKTCPRVMREVWGEICKVDEYVATLHLDATTLPTVDSTYDSKQKVSLIELLEAFESRPSPNTIGDSSPHIRVPCLPSDPYRADVARYQTLRLLKVRDYLIMVCRDLEYLNELHSSMDAITWFQHIPSNSTNTNAAPRPVTIELKSVSLAQLTGMVSCLNLILQAMLWGLSHDSSMCFDKYEGKIQPNESSAIPLGFGLQNLFDPVQPQAYDNNACKRGANVVSDYMRSFDVGLVAFNDEVEKLSAILSKALTLQCNVHIVASKEPKERPVHYGVEQIPELRWTSFDLGCMGELIQGRRVWALKQVNAHISLDVSGNPHKAYIRTKIIDLARIWGPIWEVTEPIDDMYVWYRLPGGYLGPTGIQTSSQSDEAPCHFSTDSYDFDGRPVTYSRVPTTSYLLIGQGLPTGLKRRESCQIGLERGLHGLALQTIGTRAPHKYIDSMTGQLGFGQWGLSANWSTQIKTNPGILAKDSYLQRWKLEPEFRNPRMLLLWYGIEISLCTRNARRCRVIDLLRSHVILQYLKAMYTQQDSTAGHVPALLAALKSANPYELLILYDAHPEWRRELGKVVGRCLELLEDTGVNSHGDLAAFAFLEKLDDPEQLTIIPATTCTWIGLLKDTFDMATFAVISPNCLEYPRAPGRRCRRKDQSRISKSVLETSYIPAERLSVQKLFQTMRPNDRLKMKTSGKFKIKQRSSNGIALFGTWSYLSLRYKLLPSRFDELFQEKPQEKEPAIKVFVVSKRTQSLIRFKEKRKPTSEPREKGNKSKQPSMSDDEDNSDQSQSSTASSTKYTLPSMNTETPTKVPSQATPSKSSLQSSEAEVAKPAQRTQDGNLPNVLQITNGNITSQTQKPKLVDKGVQANLLQERRDLHQQPGNGVDQSPTDPEPTTIPSRSRGKQKQRTNNDEGPAVHQASSNPALLSPDVDTFTNASREKERRHRHKGSRTQQRERSDAESPPLSSHRRLRSDTSGDGSQQKDRRSRPSVEDTGGSVRVSIAKSFGLGYHK